ncbi:MAG TPA: hypothetical protein VF194_08140 [Ferrovibrio sp.]|uniref:hypothetical protein n=1 Tax=Ferrovibrio sp. TaxID=1917215 RepID=UPI002ED2CC3F
MFSRLRNPAGSRSAAGDAIDWKRVARWTDDVAAADLKRIRKVFERHTGSAVELVWEPAKDALPPVLGFLAEHWFALSAAAAGGPPHLSQIDPFALRPALGHVIQFDVLDGGADFHCRLYGSTIAAISGFDMTGKRLSEFPASHYVAEYALAQSRAACRRRRPLYSRRRPARAEFVSSWHRLTLPFVDDAGDVARLLIGSLPTDAEGNIANY